MYTNKYYYYYYYYYVVARSSCTREDFTGKTYYCSKKIGKNTEFALFVHTLNLYRPCVGAYRTTQ